MRRHRPKPVHDPDLFSRTYSCTARRWHAGSLTLLIAVALVVVSAAEVADATRTYARRRSRRQGVDGAGFISPASTADSWASFPRPNDEIRPLGGLGGTAARGGGSYHRHNCATRAASSALLCCRWQTGSRQRSGSSSVARLPRLRTSDYSSRGRGSSSSSRLLLLASAVGVDANATVAADIAPPVASAEVALPLDAGTKKKEHAPQQQQQKRQSSLIKESTSIEGKEATVIITEARGRPHTVASRAKISAANKGKKPWNVGVGHSEETRRKIAEGSKNAARRRKLKTAESLGMTLEEYDEMKKRKPVGKNPEVTEETRKKISARLKERWKDPDYRERRMLCMPNRQGIPHSEETKARISAAVKEKWNDPAYREKITNMVRTDETRAKIGKIIKAQWANPETRQERMKNMAPRTEEHNNRIAESVRSKWSDPEYRKRTSDAMKKAAYDRIIANGGVPKPPRIRRPRVPRAPGDPGGRSSRLEGVGISREAQRNLNKWARERKEAEVRLMRQSKRDQRALEAATKLAVKEAKAEAERLAKEDEAALTEGLDDLEKVLQRSTIRAKRQERMAKVAKAEAKARAAAAPKIHESVESEEQKELEQEVPEGFEMVEMNGRMVMRMKQ
ncbi:unnamed protein product [Pylaiella littoralis]